MARNKYPEETKNLIIDTAGRLFIEQGYDHTSIQDIINHLGGLSKGAIYHHFKSKEEIMTAVAEKLYSPSESEMYKIMERKDLNAKEKIKQIFYRSVIYSAQEEMFTAAPDMLKSPQLLVMYLTESVQKDATVMMHRLIEEGIEDGSIQTAYPKQVAEVIMLLGNIWLNPMVYYCEMDEMIERVRFYRDLLNLLGFDVIDDEMIQKVGEYAAIYKKNQKR